MRRVSVVQSGGDEGMDQFFIVWEVENFILKCFVSDLSLPIGSLAKVVNMRTKSDNNNHKKSHMHPATSEKQTWGDMDEQSEDFQEKKSNFCC